MPSDSSDDDFHDLGARGPLTADELRAIAKNEVSYRGMRRVAEDIGVSPSALNKIVLGGGMHASTVRRFRDWVLTLPAAYPPKAHPDRETVEAAWSRLLGDFTEDVAREIRQRLTVTFRAAYLRQGLPLPEWLREPGADPDERH